jgi:hypothetical protein
MRPIDADMLLEKIRDKLCVKSLDWLLPSERAIVKEVKNAPTIEPKQGEWIETTEGTMCSNCHLFPYDEYHIANWHSDFCPNCGARMKGADK